MPLTLSRRHALALAGASALTPAAYAQGTFPDRAGEEYRK